MFGIRKLDSYEKAERHYVVKEIVNDFFIGLLTGAFIFNILYFFYTIFAAIFRGKTIQFEDAYRYYEVPHIIFISIVVVGLGYFMNKSLKNMGIGDLCRKTSVAVYELVAFIYPLIVYIVYVVNSNL